MLSVVWLLLACICFDLLAHNSAIKLQRINRLNRFYGCLLLDANLLAISAMLQDKGNLGKRGTCQETYMASW